MSSTSAWLCACLRDVGAGTDLAGPPPVAWARLPAIAEAEGLAPALGAWLARRPDPDVPPAVAARLTARLRQSLARHVVMSRDLATLLRRLGDERIDAIPLKGAFLAETVYPSPALRPLSDVDLLVRPDDRLRVDALVRDLGYARGVDAHSWEFDMAYDGATSYDGPGGARLDLHWSLLNDPRSPRDAAEVAAVWERATPVTLAGARALALAHEDLVVYLAAHLAIHHALAGLVWYWDLALVVAHAGPRLDWSIVVERAGRWRVRRALFFVLLRLRELFGVVVDERVAAALAPRGLRAQALRRLIDSPADRLGRLDHLVPLLLADRSADVASMLATALAPSRAWLAARYGRRGSAALAAHYRRLATVVGSTGSSLFRRRGPA